MIRDDLVRMSSVHKIIGTTWLFGKEYVWLRDPEGTHYLEKIEDE